VLITKPTEIKMVIGPASSNWEVISGAYFLRGDYFPSGGMPNIKIGNEILKYISQ
jgi:hypothetical protein